MQVGPSYKFISKNNKEISAKNLNYFTPSLLPPRQTNISFYLLERKNVAVLCYMQSSHKLTFYYFTTTLTMKLIILIIKKFTQTVVFIVHQFISVNCIKFSST